MRRVAHARLIALLLAPAGCASLDPKADIATAASAVEQRTGLEAHWDAPWDHVDPLWSGREPLSSDVAVTIALQANRSMRQQVEAIVATRADYVQAHLLPNPVVTVALGIPIDGGGGSPLFAGLIQQLAALWQRPTRIDGAEADLQREVLAVSDGALRLVTQVRMAHAAVTFADRAVALQTQNVDLIEDSLELDAQHYEVGESTQLDLNRLELELLQAQTESVRRKAEADRARTDLLSLLGRAGDALDFATDDRVPSAVDRLSALDGELLLAMAGAQRLDVAAALARQESAVARLKLARLGAVPDVSAGASYQREFSGREGIFPTIAVTPPLFDDNRADRARASELRTAQIEVDRVLQQSQQEVRTAWINVQSSLRLVNDLQGRIVRLADENASLAQEAFAAGTVDLTVLLEAKRQQTSARTRLNDLELSMVRQIFELERAAGGSLDPGVATAGAERGRESGQEYSS